MKLISLLLDKLLNLLIVVGVIGLIMGIINTFKGRPQQAKYGFLLFGVLVLAIVLSHVFSWIISKIEQKKDAMKAATDTAVPSALPPIQEQPLTVLGMVVIMENSPSSFTNNGPCVYCRHFNCFFAFPLFFDLSDIAS